MTGVHEETELEGEILGASMHLGSMRNKTKTGVYTITTIITKEGKEGTKNLIRLLPELPLQT